MKKLYLFDDFGVALILCEFAGLDQEGKPQFVVKTPGKPLMSLEDYQEKIILFDSYHMIFYDLSWLNQNQSEKSESDEE